MKLTRATGYALQALISLAKAGPERPVVSGLIETGDGMPGEFLRAIPKRLAQTRLLLSRKGPGGGYRLARLPQRISLLEVIEAVEGPIYGQAPAVGQGKYAALDKRLEAECEKVAAVTRSVLGKVNIKDLVGK
jgi:Rrf2 family protein